MKVWIAPVAALALAGCELFEHDPPIDAPWVDGGGLPDAALLDGPPILPIDATVDAWWGDGSGPPPCRLVQSPGTIAEGGSAVFSIMLAWPPPALSTAILTISDPSRAVLLPDALTFSPAGWNLPQSFTVLTFEDADTADDQLSIDCTTGVVHDRFTFTVIDDEQVRLILEPTSITVPEGGSGTLAVRLSQPPAGSVVVTASTTEPAELSVAPAMLTFTPGGWNQPQLVTVTTVQDPDGVDDFTTVTVSAVGTAPRSATVQTDDDEVQQRCLASLSSIALTEPGGPAVPISFSLAAPPPGPLTVPITIADPSVATATPPTLTFTPANHATPQTVMVAAVDDADAISENTHLNCAVPGSLFSPVQISVADHTGP